MLKELKVMWESGDYGFDTGICIITSDENGRYQLDDWIKKPPKNVSCVEALRTLVTISQRMIQALEKIERGSDES